jgi:hypothetical protein
MVTEERFWATLILQRLVMHVTKESGETNTRYPWCQTHTGAFRVHVLFMTWASQALF